MNQPKDKTWLMSEGGSSEPSHEPSKEGLNPESSPRDLDLELINRIELKKNPPTPQPKECKHFPKPGYSKCPICSQSISEDSWEERKAIVVGDMIIKGIIPSPSKEFKHEHLLSLIKYMGELLSQSRISLLEEVRGKIEGMRNKQEDWPTERCIGYERACDDILAKLK